MEGVRSQDRSRLSSQPSQRPRGPSKSKANSYVRMTPQSSNSSAISLNQSPSLRLAHPALRGPQPERRGSRDSNSDRPQSQISKQSAEGSHSSRHHQVPASSFLQEKLQRERISEMERSSSRMGSEMGPLAEGRAVPASPARCATADGRRPDTSGTGADPTKKKGVGLKEMEQVCRRPMHMPDCVSQIH